MNDPETITQPNTLPIKEAPQLTHQEMLTLAVQIFHTNRASYTRRLLDPMQLPIVADEMEAEIRRQAIKKLYGDKDSWLHTMNRVDSLPTLELIEFLKQQISTTEQ